MSPPEIARQLRGVLGELTAFARFLAGGSDDADDLVQDTLSRAFSAMSRGAGPERAPSLRAWVFAIARNAHVDLRRSRASREKFVVLEGGLEELCAVETAPPQLARIDRVDLERALAALPEGARAALLLSDLWEFDQEEIASILEIPVGTVKSRVARARAHVAATLGSDAQAKGKGA